jgi:hemoglobin
MPTPQPCTEEEIFRLVHDFYASARADTMLGPIFEAHVRDWDGHLAKMVDFWSSALLGTARYRGTPLPVHVALPDLSSELFGRWLSLFRHSTRAFANAQARERANELAQRIAQSLWFGYQLNRDPAALPRALA